MKAKKFITALVIFVVIVGLVASYVFTGFTPPPQPTAPTRQVQPVTQQGTPPLPFTGPVGNPSVKGPSAPPGSQ